MQRGEANLSMSIREVGYCLRGSVLEPGKTPRSLLFQPSLPLDKDPPRISCMMPTRGHIFPARYAIESFLAQDYPNRELVVVCQTADSEVEAFLSALGDPRISFFHAPDAKNVGEMRNVAVAKANGALICTWDDDDLYPSTRLGIQYRALERGGANACFLSRIILWSPAAARLGISSHRAWENSMLAERDVIPEYESRVREEDTIAVRHIFDNATAVIVDSPQCLCYIRHGKNISDPRHFSQLYAAATARYEGDDYLRGVADLSADIPTTEFALRFFEELRRGRLKAAPQPVPRSEKAAALAAAKVRS